MRICLIASPSQRGELLNALSESPDIDVSEVSIDSIPSLTRGDVCIDLQFENNGGREAALLNCGAGAILVSWESGGAVPAAFSRVCTWPGFLGRPIIELIAGADTDSKLIESALAQLGKKVAWVPDQPGYVAARVIACIVNEAYFALQEGVSSREEIDTAMKTGTNYPYGPFEWSRHIGIGRIHRLLSEMSATDSRYIPATMLTEDATKQDVATTSH